MATDLDQLVDMGFEREKSQMALQKGGNLPSAIDWLDKNADKTLEELQEASKPQEGLPDPDASAKSMVCNDCGKKFRGMAQAQFHAEKTGHDDFAESAEELAPLTEAERATRLAELKEKLKLKRAGQAEEEKVIARRNEEIRKKHTKEQDDAKEALARKEQMKDAARKKQEKADDVAAKKRIRDKIEADKAERRRKAEEEKAMRANPAAYNPTVAGGGAGPATAQGAKASHAEARLRLQTPVGNVMRTFPAGTTLFEVAHAVQLENGTEAASFTLNFPKKTFEREDFGLTLQEAGLVPSAALIVK